VITVKNLTRKYGTFTAVNSISFEIPKGQIVGLLGHNGAGKTTTLKMLTGFLEPSSGEVSIDDVNIASDLMAAQKKIGYLSEQSPLYPDMTVWQYLYYVAEMRGIAADKISQAVHDAIIDTDLVPKAQELITTLSRGYQQRVGVAQAIIHKPDILVLDEPTNGLDPTQIMAMRQLIKNLSRKATVILSTHILQEVEAICDRVIIILNGHKAIDDKLSHLQKNNTILLTLRESYTDVKNALTGVQGVQSIESLPSQTSMSEYAVKFEGSMESIAPAIAKTVVNKGWELYRLQVESRDLETVFNEINRGVKGVSHV
jgi:ABC-2 type transport system ATP-binding protein